VFPERNDSPVVQGTSRSYCQELLASNVQIFEYRPGLLHTKSLTLDGEFMMIGSANMDRRSFDLNYENNMLIDDRDMVAKVIDRQHAYIADSTRITLDNVRSWSVAKRLWNKSVAILGPIL